MRYCGKKTVHTNGRTNERTNERTITAVEQPENIMHLPTLTDGESIKRPVRENGQYAVRKVLTDWTTDWSFKLNYIPLVLTSLRQHCSIESWCHSHPTRYVSIQLEIVTKLRRNTTTSRCLSNVERADEWTPIEHNNSELISSRAQTVYLLGRPRWGSIFEIS